MRDYDVLHRLKNPEKARFLVSADWQLGMRRRYLGEEAQPRFVQARIDAVKAIGAVAAQQECEFVAVGGDVFESNQVDRRTLVRTLDALGAFPCPVLLLPGNHDPLDAASIYRSATFRDQQPKNVHVLADATPFVVRPGLEVVGAPWPSKRPRRDLVAERLAALAPADGLRVLVAHGAVDSMNPDRNDPATIALDPVRAALADGRVHFVALGDHHSAHEVLARVWYPGAPEATSFRETDPGHVLLVELDRAECLVERHQIGRWRFVRVEREVGAADDITALGRDLAALPDKDTTALRVRLAGTLSLATHARWEAVLAESRATFAAVRVKDADLAVLPDDLDWSELELRGFAEAAVRELAEASAGSAGNGSSDAQAACARDALGLLYRLAREEQA